MVCYKPFLKNFLLKKFSRICCLLFSYQCSLFVVVCDSLFRLSHLSLFVNNFFNFFCFIASSSFSRCLVCDSSFILACTLYSVNTFSKLFSSYLKKCFISFHAFLYHIFQVEQPRDLARDSGQRKLTHSFQNHCASSRSVYLSRRLDSMSST